MQFLLIGPIWLVVAPVPPARLPSRRYVDACDGPARTRRHPTCCISEDLPEPVLRDTDVLVEVHATSVNPVDTKVRARASGAA